MIGDHRVLALVAARSGSKGLPGKNIRDFCGQPLLAWPIAAACQAPSVDAVAITTDSEDYADAARVAGAQHVVMRPAELASDTASSIDAVLHALDTLAGQGHDFDIVLLLEPTSPLTEASDIEAALAQLEDGIAATPPATAIVGVSALEAHHPAFAIRREDGGRIASYAGGDFGQLPRRQDIDAVFTLDGTLYASTVAALRERRAFCHDATLGYVSPRGKGVEIDDATDWTCAEALMRARIDNERTN